MGKPTYDSLGDFMHDIDTYHGGWDGYLERFVRCSPDKHVVELSAYDALLEAETAPSRQTAEYIQKRRQIGDIHKTLNRAKR